MLIKFLVAAIGAGVPLLFGTTGEILNEKVGHLNLGVEGMMAIGACSGFMAGYYSNSFLVAIIAAFLGGMFGALIYAVLTVSLMANQNVAGLTLTIFGVGLANFIGIFVRTKTEDGVLKLPERITKIMFGGSIPGLGKIPVLGELFFSYSPFVYIAIVIAIVVYFFYTKTKTGLNIQSIGHNPAAADAAGIEVKKLKYINILIGGGICGLGGAYCSMIINGGKWISDNIGGLGWIAVALVILARWNSCYAILGSFVFGAFRVMKYYIPKSVVPLPNAFYDMLPFLITAIVLVVSSITSKKDRSMPEYLGVNYFREER